MRSSLNWRRFSAKFNVDPWNHFAPGIDLILSTTCVWFGVYNIAIVPDLFPKLRNIFKTNYGAVHNHFNFDCMIIDCIIAVSSAILDFSGELGFQRIFS